MSKEIFQVPLKNKRGKIKRDVIYQECDKGGLCIIDPPGEIIDNAFRLEIKKQE